MAGTILSVQIISASVSITKEVLRGLPLDDEPKGLPHGGGHVDAPPQISKAALKEKEQAAFEKLVEVRMKAIANNHALMGTDHIVRVLRRETTSKYESDVNVEAAKRYYVRLLDKLNKT